jgi:hypothetical protein
MTAKLANCVVAGLQERGVKADEAIDFDSAKTDAKSEKVGETIKQVTLACVSPK